MKHTLSKMINRAFAGAILTKYMFAAVTVASYGLIVANDAQAACRAYGPQPGLYVNVDRNTQEVTRFRLTYTCNDAIAIPADATPAEREAILQRSGESWSLQMWGKCHPRDCAWGATTARPSPVGRVQNLSASYNQGFVRRFIVLRPNGSRVQLVLSSRYRDGRAARNTSSFFRRARL